MNTPIRLRHQPGEFGWNELHTRDARVSARYYQALFGWECVPLEMENGFTYHLFQRNGVPVAGMLQVTDENISSIPGWVAYVHVRDIEQSCAIATAQGGRVLFPPKEIPDRGKIVAVLGPDDTLLSLWQAPQVQANIQE